jgi:hypothetical protein
MYQAVFLLHASVAEIHTASINRAEVRSNVKWMVYIGIED